ncbi:sugar O-acyltransferase, sialic acid O-acetyltransferase NeuD family [Lachnospiraceae bacterium XBB1006]|nr:sugar O-acyltransferase, sialic acid O-acetyltransferase NeuD family [Lachnospiraceae bacterium XBB1006]
MSNNILIIGFGGHAKSVADCIIRNEQYNIVGYTDVEDKKADFPYLGTDDVLKDLVKSHAANAALGMGFMGGADIRDRIVEVAEKAGLRFPVIADPSAILAKNAAIGDGTFIGKRAVVNAEATVGRFCIINTGAIIEHENEIGDFSHIAVGATLCGNVKVGRHCLIGAGTTVIQGVTIGDNCVIGAGSLVLGDVPSNSKVVGIVKGVKNE